MSWDLWGRPAKATVVNICCDTEIDLTAKLIPRTCGFTEVFDAKDSCGLMLVDEGLSAFDRFNAERVSKVHVDFIDAKKTLTAVTHTPVPLVHCENVILRMEGGSSC
ncbi:hypothetical protein BDZ89DRAFT_1127029 [Hymenopellis radicata]|nr:hypothetical protein BDZ89DRAFT_1127029 [Hymenopellis radicata]